MEPGEGRGAWWMQGGTGQPGYSVAMRPSGVTGRLCRKSSSNVKTPSPGPIFRQLRQNFPAKHAANKGHSRGSGTCLSGVLKNQALFGCRSFQMGGMSFAKNRFREELSFFSSRRLRVGARIDAVWGWRQRGRRRGLIPFLPGIRLRWLW